MANVTVYLYNPNAVSRERAQETLDEFCMNLAGYHRIVQAEVKNDPPPIFVKGWNTTTAVFVTSDADPGTFASLKLIGQATINSLKSSGVGFLIVTQVA